MLGWQPAFEGDTARPPADQIPGLAMTAWNLMGDQVDWSALDLVGELLGVQDVERWIYALVQIRDHRSDNDQPKQ